MGPGPQATPSRGSPASPASPTTRRTPRRSRTIDELLTRADLKGKVSLLSEMRDTMGLHAHVDGADPEDFTDDEFDDALDELKKAVDSGQIRQFTGNDYIHDLQRGDIAACIAGPAT